MADPYKDARKTIKFVSSLLDSFKALDDELERVTSIENAVKATQQRQRDAEAALASKASELEALTAKHGDMVAAIGKAKAERDAIGAQSEQIAADAAARAKAVRDEAEAEKKRLIEEGETHAASVLAAADHRAKETDKATADASARLSDLEIQIAESRGVLAGVNAEIDRLRSRFAS